MRRLMPVPFLLLLAMAGCDNSSTAPGEGAVRGLGFTNPISATALRQLEGLGTVLSVSHAARVVMMQTTQPWSRLAEVAGEPSVGPDLGAPDSLRIEVEADYAAAPTTDDLMTLSAIGTVTNVFHFSDLHSVFLMVPVRDLGRLDNVPNATTIWIVYDPPRPASPLLTSRAAPR